LGVLSPLFPLFQLYPQMKEILLNLSMKCWNSAFNAQSSRYIIVIVQVGSVKIYVVAVEALRKNQRQRKIFKIGGRTSLRPSYFVL
jgi:hypothetical protein